MDTAMEGDEMSLDDILDGWVEEEERLQQAVEELNLDGYEEHAGDAEAVADDEGVAADNDDYDMEGDDLAGDDNGSGGGAEVAGEEWREEDVMAAMKARKEQEDQRLQAKIASMSEEELDRYEVCNRSALPRPKVNQVMKKVIGTNVKEPMLIAMCGIGKLFVGDLVRRALKAAYDQGHVGPLLPSHVHQAYQALDVEKMIPKPPDATRKSMFK